MTNDFNMTTNLTIYPAFQVLVLFIKNGRLPLQLIKKNTVEMQEDFLRKFCGCVCSVTDISGSLTILDNISVILSTKVRKNMIPIHLLAFHHLQALGAHQLDN